MNEQLRDLLAAAVRDGSIGEHAGAIADAIRFGRLDGGLDQIGAALSYRRSATALREQASFRIGDKVRFNDKTRPQYMQGVVGEVVGRGTKNVQVNHPPAGRFSGRRTSVPPSLLEKVEG